MLDWGPCQSVPLTPGNVILEKDAADNWKPSKRRSKEKFDGIVALIMALGRAVVAPPTTEFRPMVFWIPADGEDSGYWIGDPTNP